MSVEVFMGRARAQLLNAGIIRHNKSGEGRRAGAGAGRGWEEWVEAGSEAQQELGLGTAAGACACCTCLHSGAPASLLGPNVSEAQSPPPLPQHPSTHIQPPTCLPAPPLQWCRPRM